MQDDAIFRHLTSSRDGDVKADIFRCTIYPQNLVVVAFIFSELRSGGGGGGNPLPPGVEEQKS